MDNEIFLEIRNEDYLRQRKKWQYSKSIPQLPVTLSDILLINLEYLK